VLQWKTRRARPGTLFFDVIAPVRPFRTLAAHSTDKDLASGSGSSNEKICEVHPNHVRRAVLARPIFGAFRHPNAEMHRKSRQNALSEQKKSNETRRFCIVTH
jgi:hypothetical protein